MSENNQCLKEPNSWSLRPNSWSNYKVNGKSRIDIVTEKLKWLKDNNTTFQSFDDLHLTLLNELKEKGFEGNSPTSICSGIRRHNDIKNLACSLVIGIQRRIICLYQYFIVFVSKQRIKLVRSVSSLDR